MICQLIIVVGRWDGKEGGESDKWGLVGALLNRSVDKSVFFVEVGRWVFCFCESWKPSFPVFVGVAGWVFSVFVGAGRWGVGEVSFFFCFCGSWRGEERLFWSLVKTFCPSPGFPRCEDSWKSVWDSKEYDPTVQRKAVIHVIKGQCKIEREVKKIWEPIDWDKDKFCASISTDLSAFREKLGPPKGSQSEAMLTEYTFHQPAILYFPPIWDHWPYWLLLQHNFLGFGSWMKAFSVLGFPHGPPSDVLLICIFFADVERKYFLFSFDGNAFSSLHKSPIWSI